MKTYWPACPANTSTSRATCSGRKAMNWQTTSKFDRPSAEYAVASPLSPTIDRTPSGRAASRVPRLNTLTR